MKNIGYSEFVKICRIFEPDTWSDWLSVKYDGVYIKPPASDIYLTPEERSILTEHPTYDLTKPALSFPCSLEELRAFDEYQRLGLDFDGAYVDGKQAVPASESVTPTVMLLTSSPQAEPTIGLGWKVLKPKKWPGYRKPLYDVVKAAHAAGSPRPKAIDILDAFRKNKPLVILCVSSDSIDYQNGNGKKVTADLDAIRVAIGRITQIVKDSDD
jgi:hypothetical protein